jgi:hypothetical protein
MTRLQWLLIILAIVVLAALIAIGWKYFNFNQAPPQPSPSPSIISPSPAKTLTASPSPSASTIAWSTYTNKTFNYSVQYPSDCKVTETNFETISGPLAENHHWPWFEIYHFDSAFYHPPAGADVYDYIANNSLKTFDEIDPNKNIKISGLPAIHVMQNKSSQADASDYYYFIKDNQLFSIQIIQIEGKEDWDLYNKFLNSFTFK